MNRDTIIARFAARPAAVRCGGGAPRRGDHDLNPDLTPAPVPRPAAVLVPLVDRDRMTLLLTRRTDHLEHHPGQISFPGGRLEPEDGPPGPEAARRAALREAEEEIGLDPACVTIIGCLPRYATRTGFDVLPVVGIVQPPVRLCLDPFEVAEAFEVPLAFVLDSANHRRCSRTLDGRERHFHAMPYGERFIWGATAGMLVSLHEFLR